MQATLPIPPLDEFGIPAPAGAFQFLIILTMFLHFLFMNFTLGGAIVATLLDLLTLLQRGNHNLTVRVIWQVIPVTLSFTITTGVAPLLFVQVMFGSFFYPATIFMGLSWLAIIGILLLAFYLTYFLSYRLGSLISNRIGVWNRSPAARLGVSLACAMLFASVAWILTNTHMLSVQPKEWAQQGEWAQNRLLVTPALTVPRYLHFVGGALAVTGLWLACIGWWRKRRRVDPPEIAEQIIRTGLWTALCMIAVASVLGPIFFFLLPGDIRGALLRPSVYSVLWWIALVGVAAQLFFAIMAVRQPRQFTWVAGLLAGMMVTVVGMLSGREQVRLSYLARPEVGFAPSDWKVAFQVSSLTVFIVLFVAGLATVGWLLWISVIAPQAPLDYRAGRPDAAGERGQLGVTAAEDRRGQPGGA